MSRQRISASGNAGNKEKISPSTLYDEGLRHFKRGRLAIAEEHFRQALAFDPNHADSLHLLGLIHSQADDLDPAIAFIAGAIRSDPNVPDYFSNLAALLGRQGKFEEAAKSYDLALKLKPDFVHVWIRLGDLLQNQERFDEALLTYDHALTLDPRSAEALSHGGLLLLKLERYEEALAKLDLLQTIRPGQAEVFFHRGVCLKGLARPGEAAESYRKALKIAPRNHETHNNLGAVLLDLRSFDEALKHFRRAIEIKSDFVPALNNLGIALLDLRRFEEALSAFDQAIALKPDYAEAHNNRGNCLEEMMRMGEALFGYRNALALRPDYAEAHWNFAINRLRIGDLKTGWVESEWRWKCPALQLRQRDFDQPLWLGAERIEDKILLLHGDQGLGDALQFLRYAPLVAARGARVFLEIDPTLHELCSGLKGVSRIISKGEALPAFDFHCPLSSLPLAFDTTLNSIPSVTPYLSVGDNGTAWKQRLSSMDSPRVGLVWAGNPNHRNDHNRSISLETLLPLLDVKAQFFSLQKEVRPHDQALLRERTEIIDLGSELRSFAETAAVIENLDLLISVDTSVAHLAGALGRPVWIFLPYVPDWRWLLMRTDSPWYPTARLFRQSEARDWQSVVRQASAALQVFGQHG